MPGGKASLIIHLPIPGICWAAIMLLALLGCPSDRMTSGDGAPMARIAEGRFVMGSDSGESDERPPHSVYLDTFYLDVYEVTNAQYQRFLDATDRPHIQEQVTVSGQFEKQPVVWVSWEDARDYCEWARKRLPTEAEWEKAARGGLTGARFPWGSNPPYEEGRHRASSSEFNDGYRATAPVGCFAANPYGLHDMAGNVWEWRSDWYDRNYYAVSPGRSPKGPETGSARAIRGGSWDDGANALTVSYRGANQPLARSDSIGFRCAK